MGVAAYEAIGKRLGTLGFPYLEQAVCAEVASFDTEGGEEWNTLQKEMSALDRNTHHRTYTINPGMSETYNNNSKRSINSKKKRGRRNSVLRDYDFTWNRKKQNKTRRRLKSNWNCLNELDDKEDVRGVELKLVVFSAWGNVDKLYNNFFFLF